MALNETTNSEGLEEARKQYLKSLGLLGDKSILDCDPVAETITFRTENGELMTRQACQVFTRVMGYHRPTVSFNIGKKAEHAERRFFTQTKAEHSNPAMSRYAQHVC